MIYKASIILALCQTVYASLFLKVTGQQKHADVLKLEDNNSRLVVENVNKKDTPHDSFSANTDPNGPKPAWVDNPLAEYFWKYTTGLKIWKWHHYFRVYHRHLNQLTMFPGQRINMLVIGVQSGGEIGMWQNYFGKDFHFYGIDINPACKVLFFFLTELFPSALCFSRVSIEILLEVVNSIFVLGNLGLCVLDVFSKKGIGKSIRAYQDLHRGSRRSKFPFVCRIGGAFEFLVAICDFDM